MIPMSPMNRNEPIPDEVPLGHQTVHRHGAEHAGGDEKGCGNGGRGVGQKNGRQGQAVQHRVPDKQAGGGGGLYLLNPGGQEKNQAQFRQDQDEKKRGGDNGPGQSGVGRQEGDASGERQADGHPVEYLGEKNR